MEQSAATVEKALDVLFHLHAERRACGVSEIGRALGMPRSTTHRLLQALLRRSLVERSGRGRYRPGIGLVALGLGVLSVDPVVAAARPVLEAEAALGDETLFLAGPRAGRVVVLDKVEGAGFLRASPRIGEAVPPDRTAVGQICLAFQPELVSLGSSIRAALAADLAQVRRTRFAANDEDWIAGLSGVAAPVLLDGNLMAALAIAGPSAHLETHPNGPSAERVRAAARRVEDRLQGHPGPALSREKGGAAR